MEAVAESARKERDPRVNTRFSLGVENGRADAKQDGRTCLARPNLLDIGREREKNIFLFSWPRTGLATILVHVQSAICML